MPFTRQRFSLIRDNLKKQLCQEVKSKTFKSITYWLTLSEALPRRYQAFSLTKIYDSHDSRGRERLSL